MIINDKTSFSESDSKSLLLHSMLITQSYMRVMITYNQSIPSENLGLYLKSLVCENDAYDMDVMMTSAALVYAGLTQWFRNKH